jgi:L-seryl-tRNA(Ser) seleniumtransferase
MGAGERAAALRGLPAVERLASSLDGPRALAVRAAREVVAWRREQLRRDGPAPADPDLRALAQARLDALAAPSLRRVVNATGVIVHTNLGRAPLAAAARAAVARAAEGYSNLELDVARGGRGSRHDHVAGLIADVTGAEDGFAVNNGAAAVLLAVAALAGPGREVVVSRGQLVEIGGGFRVPDVVAQSGARLVEVGTTNRTRAGDYEQAIGPATGALLRAHPSNFRQVGFVEEVEIEALCALGVPVIDDVGSGALGDGFEGELSGGSSRGRSGGLGLEGEPPVRRSVAAGAALVCFSGDKLLGGPQAGILAGRADAVARARAHPLARAARIDKLSLAALEATLALHRDPDAARREIPVLAMLSASEDELWARAARLAAAFGGAEIVRATARVGGGALPLLELEGPAVALDASLAHELRAGDPPVVGRVHEGRLLLDPRTMTDEEVAWVAARR